MHIVATAANANPRRLVRGSPAYHQAALQRLLRYALAKDISDDFLLLSPLALSGEARPIDAVIVGPSVRVLKLVLVPRSVELRATGQRWEIRTATEHWLATDENYGLQARASSRQVVYALRSAALPVYKILPIVLVMGQGRVLATNSSVPVQRLAGLISHLKKDAPTLQLSKVQTIGHALAVASDYALRK